jgi:hypothetical protein
LTGGAGGPVGGGGAGGGAGGGSAGGGGVEPVEWWVSPPLGEGEWDGAGAGALNPPCTPLSVCAAG